MAQRKRRLTKGDTFTFARDDKTGETLIRCLNCTEHYQPKDAWSHRCKPKETNDKP
jgi:uncharacterized OB-fold protein